MAAALRVSLDLDSPTPAYRQIANDLRRHLVEERLKPGDLLPPIRQLALDLGVHFNTVALAYRLLADEGWLELKRRRGADRDRAERAAGDRSAPGRSAAAAAGTYRRRTAQRRHELHGRSRRRCVASRKEHDHDVRLPGP